MAGDGTHLLDLYWLEFLSPFSIGLHQYLQAESLWVEDSDGSCSFGRYCECVRYYSLELQLHCVLGPVITFSIFIIHV
jgi:hypothetical protein